VQAATQHGSLLAALEVGRGDVVALVGGGGKTAALQLLVEECLAAGDSRRVLATTTTAMLLTELQGIAPLVVQPLLPRLKADLEEHLGRSRSATAARALGPDGKVLGLPTEWIDELWASGPIDQVVVEADGSRGASLKAFAPYEPQVPSTTALLVQVAGMDVLGLPLAEPHVHRAYLLADLLDVPIGSMITPGLLAKAIGAQLRILRERWPMARRVTLLNKAESADAQAAALSLARELLTSARDNGPGVPPHSVVVGSVRERRFDRLSAPERGQEGTSYAEGLTRRPPIVSAIILAAGRATRMGGQKVLLPVGDRSMLRRVVDAATGSAAAEVIVVVGSDALDVAGTLRDLPVGIVENPDFAQGMSTSLRAGLRAARSDCEAVIFLLADQPFVTPAAVDMLIARFAATGALVVRPVINGREAHPVLMAAGLFLEILEQEGDRGGREVIRGHRNELELVPLDDSRMAMDIDTPDDYEAATRPESW
jgi:molybdenum cofactor cytidylyltransferase